MWKRDYIYLGGVNKSWSMRWIVILRNRISAQFEKQISNFGKFRKYCLVLESVPSLGWRAENQDGCLFVLLFLGDRITVKLSKNVPSKPFPWNAPKNCLGQKKASRSSKFMKPWGTVHLQCRLLRELSLLMRTKNIQRTGTWDPPHLLVHVWFHCRASHRGNSLGASGEACFHGCFRGCLRKKLPWMERQDRTVGTLFGFVPPPFTTMPVLWCKHVSDGPGGKLETGRKRRRRERGREEAKGREKVGKSRRKNWR